MRCKIVKKTNLSKILSVFLSVLMMSGVLCLFSFASDDSVTVYFSAVDQSSSYENGVIMAEKEITVSKGDAVKYGYKNAASDHNGNEVDYVTALDAIADASYLVYGSEDGVKNSLTVSSGYMSKAFSSYGPWMITVNGSMPHDDILLSWGYTGYSVDEMEIKNGDHINLSVYYDKTGYSDYITSVEAPENVKAGDGFKVKVTGYSSYVAMSGDDAVKSATYPVDGVEIYKITDGKSALLGKTDSNGELTVKTSKKDTENYIIMAKGSASATADGSSTAVSNSFAEVNIKLSFIGHIIKFFKTIADFFAKLFK